MNVKKRMFIIMLLVFFLLGILVSAAVAGGDEGQGTKLKRVTVALPIAPPTLDPWDHRSPPASLVQRNLTDALGVFTDTGGLILNVAESMTQIDDVTWEFKCETHFYAFFETFLLAFHPALILRFL